MATSHSNRSVSSQSATHSYIASVKDLINQLYLCRHTQFTGQLTANLQTPQTPYWDFYFYQGGLVTGTSTVHPIRRWRRQFSHVCPNLDAALVVSNFDPHQPWDYQPLMELVRQRQLSLKQMVAIVEGVLVEILFDLIQKKHQHQYHDSPLQLTQRALSQHRFKSELIEVQPALVFQSAIQAWQGWSQAGLAHYSANYAPVIWDAAALRQQTSFLVYCNMMSWINGDLTLRDLAINCKQDLAALTQSILPYIHKEMIGLVEVKDWLDWRPSKGLPNARSTLSNPPVQGMQAHSSSPMMVYIEPI